MTSITPSTAARLAAVRKRIAGAADDLYAIDRDTLDAPGWIALIAAANDIREAEHALARMLGERPTREYRNEYGEVTTDPTVAEGGVTPPSKPTTATPPKTAGARSTTKARKPSPPTGSPTTRPVKPPSKPKAAAHRPACHHHAGAESPRQLPETAP